MRKKLKVRVRAIVKKKKDNLEDESVKRENKSSIFSAWSCLSSDCSQAAKMKVKNERKV